MDPLAKLVLSILPPTTYKVPLTSISFALYLNYDIKVYIMHLFMDKAVHVDMYVYVNIEIYVYI